MVSFFVQGDPKPQGSKTGFIRGGRVILKESSEALPAWRTAIKQATQQHHEGEPIDQPVKVTVDFFMPKPAKPMFDMPATAPDLDKLCRAIGDGLEQGGALRNDSRIVEWAARKHYATDMTGAQIEITTL